MGDTGRERRTERGKGRTTISPSIFVLFCLPHHIRVPQPHSVRSFLLRRSLGALTDGCAADSPVTARTGDTGTERGRGSVDKRACRSVRRLTRFQSGGRRGALARLPSRCSSPLSLSVSVSPWCDRQSLLLLLLPAPPHRARALASASLSLSPRCRRRPTLMQFRQTEGCDYN